MRHLTLSLLILIALSSQISAQSILKDGKIPEDLVITLHLNGTARFVDYYNYKITSDGKIFYEEFINSLPVERSSQELLSLQVGNKMPKPPKLKDSLSKKQLKQIITKFEKSGFYEMNEYYQGDPTLKEVFCWQHDTSKGLSISANGKTKKVGFFLGCSYGENSPLKSFLSLYDFISKEISGVKKNKVTK